MGGWIGPTLQKSVLRFLFNSGRNTPTLRSLGSGSWSFPQLQVIAPIRGPVYVYIITSWLTPYNAQYMRPQKRSGSTAS